jgi:hypothetical protein
MYLLASDKGNKHEEFNAAVFANTAERMGK